MCVLTLTLIIEGYFYSVVYRAWKYMKLERFEESRRQQHVVAESACSKGGRQRVTPISIQKHVETSFPSAPNYY
jgi:hypothetical protein